MDEKKLKILKWVTVGVSVAAGAVGTILETKLGFKVQEKKALEVAEKAAKELADKKSS